jgi:two-component system, LytTR family, response regulator
LIKEKKNYLRAIEIRRWILRKKREMTKAVIIEDEPAGVEVLKAIIAKHCPDVEIIATGGSNADALRIFEDPNLRPHVAFLDIHLPDGQIFQTLKQLEEIDFEIIFVTAFEQYAVRAFKLAAIDYLLKPIDPLEIMRAVSRIRAGKFMDAAPRLDIAQSHLNHPNSYDKIAISALDGSHYVRLRDIIRLEGSDNYTHIYLKGEKFTASKTLKFFEEILIPFNFFRTHKTHLINLNYIKNWKREDGGRLILEDGSKVEVSRRRKPTFMEAVKQLESGRAE